MTRQQKIQHFLLLALFIIAPLYTYPNLGGVGLAMPFNIAIWALAAIFISFMLFTSLKSNVFSYSPQFLLCLIFPLLITMVSFFDEIAIANLWLFRLLYIIGGYLFIVALFQTRFTMLAVEKVLYLIVIAITVHSLVGLLQVIDISNFSQKIPMSGRGKPPFGIFQQVNLLATYLATGMMIILFLMSRPAYSSKIRAIKVWLVMTFGLSLFIVLATGSRIGLLSLLVSLPIIVIARKKQLLRHRKTVLALAIVSIFAVLASTTTLLPEVHKSGLERAFTKTSTLSEEGYKTYREGMYKIGIDLIKEKPLLGHGFTSFPRVWTEGKAKFIAQHPDAAVSPLGTGHPHNELLLWLIEGGAVAGMGLLIVFLAIAKALYNCGLSRGGAYLALLLPISLHTQTAWPFYGSAMHWFLWLFIIYMVFRHQTKTVSFNISQFGRYFLQIMVVVVGVGSLGFLWHTHKAHDELYKYMGGEKADMQLVINNAYFNRFAEKVLMQSVLYSSIEKQNTAPIPNFIVWAEGRLAVNAEPGMFIMLNDAYGFIGDKQNQCRIAKNGLNVYPDNARLQKTIDKCNETFAR
jgi:O-antigen polymerase